MNRQLYKIIKGVEYPSRNALYNGLVRESETLGHLQPYYAFHWPSGDPCQIVEMFLQDKAQTLSTNPLDGGTVGLYASQLSHLVRFCYQRKIEFIDLTHFDIEHMIFELIQERDKTGRPKRNNNTVKAISSTVVSFLLWIQENIFTSRALIGVDTPEKRHQIKLTSKNFRTTNGHIVNRAVLVSSLPKSTTTAKKPMPTIIRERIWNALVDLKEKQTVSKKLQGSFSDQEKREHLKYMHARRELQLILLESTGLRPQELVRIQCLENLERLRKSQLSIPTLKRRDGSHRVIPIDRQVSMKIETFIFVHREKLLARLRRAGLIDLSAPPPDTLYLSSETGTAVMPDAAYQDFRRLCLAAKIDQKSCQSMFRHRFITNMVKLHLVSFIENNPHKNKHMMTESDYRTILQKVASFTGHKSADSLLHYIDLAWEELEAFSSIYDLKKLQDSMRGICFKINEIRAEITDLRRSPKSKLIDEFETKLSEIYEIACTIPMFRPDKQADGG